MYCIKCGQKIEDGQKICSSCGTLDFSEFAPSEQHTVQQINEQAQYFPPIITAESKQGASENGNILFGIVGAFLFSLIGAFLYFVIYQVGLIAGICGLVIFVLSYFGYSLFAKSRERSCIAGLISAIVTTVVMIFISEYFCLSFEIFKAYKSQGISIFDAIRATPAFLSETEIAESVAKDLVLAYCFSFVATISTIINISKARKNERVY